MTTKFIEMINLFANLLLKIVVVYFQCLLLTIITEILPIFILKKHYLQAYLGRHFVQWYIVQSLTPGLEHNARAFMRLGFNPKMLVLLSQGHFFFEDKNENRWKCIPTDERDSCKPYSFQN